LGLLVFVLVISVISLSSLHWQQIGLQSGSRLIDQPQTWIMISKCLLDFTLVVLIILAITRCINSGKLSCNTALLVLIDLLGVWLWPAIDILLRTSSTCVTLSEVSYSFQQNNDDTDALCLPSYFSRDKMRGPRGLMLGGGGGASLVPWPLSFSRS